MKRTRTFKIKLFGMFALVLLGASVVNSCNGTETTSVKVISVK